MLERTLNQLTDFKFAEGRWVGEARKVRARIFRERSNTEYSKVKLELEECRLDLGKSFPVFSFCQELLGHESLLSPRPGVSVSGKVISHL